jgi:hypothetical protein
MEQKVITLIKRPSAGEEYPELEQYFSAGYRISTVSSCQVTAQLTASSPGIPMLHVIFVLEK